MFRGAQATVRDVEPLAGMRAAREVELAARSGARDYIRDAREAGRSWREIGAAMGFAPGGEAGVAGETAAEAAFTYAAGRSDAETEWRYGRSFAWTCGSCESVVIGHGLCSGPADDERGHAEGCARLTAAIAAWDAEAAAFDAGWEAGQ